MERETGLEPATSTLARLHSTTELLPLEWWTNRSKSKKPVSSGTRLFFLRPGADCAAGAAGGAEKTAGVVMTAPRMW